MAAFADGLGWWFQNGILLLLDAGDGLMEGMLQLLEIARVMGDFQQCLRGLLLGGPVERKAWQGGFMMFVGQRGSIEGELPSQLNRI